MKKHLLALVTAAALALPLSAQVWVGSDNFNDNSLTLQNGTINQAAGQWRNQSLASGASFAETNQRLEYTNTNTSGVYYSATRWNTPSYSFNTTANGVNLGIGGTGLSSGAPFTSSWSAQVSLTNLSTPAAGYTLTGMEIYTLPSSGNVDAYYGIYLSNDQSLGNRLMVEYGIGDGASGYTRTSSFVNIGDWQDVLVRANYDGSSKVMSFDYSLNGSTFLSTGVSYDLDGAQAQPTAVANGGMGLSLAAFSNGATGAITGGQMYFDNLSVTAVPEPSTYAAFAGLGALGLALWRRRSAQKSA